MLHVHAIYPSTFNLYALPAKQYKPVHLPKIDNFPVFYIKKGVPLCCQCQTVKDMQSEVNIVFV
jgi:hypothetical protein